MAEHSEGTDAANLMTRFRDYLSQEGLKVTRQRQAIASVFFQSNQHLSLSALVELVHRESPRIGPATVYRTMRLLSDSGLAVEHLFADGQARYEPAHEGEHHDHLICSDCGAITEFEDGLIEARQAQVAQEHGFRMVSHRHVIYGTCQREACPNQKRARSGSSSV